VDELESLLDMGHNFPALPTDQPFTGNVETGIMTELYWSSSTYVGSPYVAWGVYMWGGGVMGALKDSNGFVLPVRSGQVGTPIVTLSIIKSGSGSGEVAVTNGGAICGTNCEPVFTLNSPVTLTATPHILSTFDGWTGCTSIGANGECNVTMSDSKGVTAAFVLAPKAKIGATGYSQLSDAYAYAGATAEILTLNDVLIEDVTLHQDKAITLKGGWNASYSVLTGQTVIKGNLTIQNGSLRANGLKIRQ
jgi:hypothetical protein